MKKSLERSDFKAGKKPPANYSANISLDSSQISTITKRKDRCGRQKTLSHYLARIYLLNRLPKESSGLQKLLYSANIYLLGVRSPTFNNRQLCYDH